MHDELNAALLDVRRAYRLLADYQRRQFELLAYIRDRLGATAYYQEYVHKRPGDLSGLENVEASGLRYLPFLGLSALWLKHSGQEHYWDSHRAGDQMFGAWVRSDTGFDNYQGKFTDALPESTTSELVLSVVVCDQPGPEPYNWYDRAWLGIPYPENGTVGQTADVPGYRVYAKSINLAELGDQAGVNTAIEQWRVEASDALGCTVGKVIESAVS
ncbi:MULTISPECIES: hypothetical protein [Pseudomonas]|uniref:hypothetical protein n=1 Tax=Pseudomonas TaxID=286 RepID=UPI001FCDDC97|nr:MULTISPECIES: hypothetical protein [Pseudomonas]